MTTENEKATSIGFGGNEVIVVGLPLDEVAEMVTKALPRPTLIEFESTTTGEKMIVNPRQIKVLQEAEDRG